mgnify:CR=1 FL=1
MLDIEIKGIEKSDPETFSQLDKKYENIYAIGALAIEFRWWRELATNANTTVGDIGWHNRPLCKLFCWPYTNADGFSGEWCPFCPIYRDTWMHECNDFPAYIELLTHLQSHNKNDKLCEECNRLIEILLIDLSIIYNDLFDNHK